MTGPARLIYLHNAPVPSNAANAIQVAKMCAAFAQRGIETKLACPRSHSGGGSYETLADAYGLERQFDVVYWRPLRIPAGQLVTAFLQLWHVAGRGRTVVYTREYAFAYVAMMLRIPVVLELHTSVRDRGKRTQRRFRRLARSQFLRRVVAISGALAADIQTFEPRLIGRVLVAHDGADDPGKTREPVALGEGFHVGYVGHLYPGKGMEIVAPLAAACPWATFHVVGGRDEDIADWKARTRGTDNLHFAGHVSHREAQRYIAAMDVVLAPYLERVSGSGRGDLSRWMSPLKVFEYMALGKAMVASDLPVLREVLRPRENAMLCPPAEDGVAAWAAALEELRDDPAFRGHLGETARNEFLAKYTWEERAASILQGLGVQSG